jgi:antitoxin component YwqK of YwqJK toxin-antitoxin module
MIKCYFATVLSLLISLSTFAQESLDTFIIRNKYLSQLKNPKNGYYKFMSGKFLREAGQVKNGRMDGFWHSYYDSGLIQSVAEYNANDSIQNINGILQEYYSNGRLKREEHYTPFTGDSILCINCEEYDTILHKRKPVHWVAYLNGIIPGGVWKEYYDSGLLRMEGRLAPIIVCQRISFGKHHRKKGDLWIIPYAPSYDLCGTWKYYNEDGSLQRTVDYGPSASVSYILPYFYSLYLQLW